jgi:hypothetical protein
LLTYASIRSLINMYCKCSCFTVAAFQLFYYVVAIILASYYASRLYRHALVSYYIKCLNVFSLYVPLLLNLIVMYYHTLFASYTPLRSLNAPREHEPVKFLFCRRKIVRSKWDGRPKEAVRLFIELPENYTPKSKGANSMTTV